MKFPDVNHIGKESAMCTDRQPSVRAPKTLPFITAESRVQAFGVRLQRAPTAGSYLCQMDANWESFFRKFLYYSASNFQQ